MSWRTKGKKHRRRGGIRWVDANRDDIGWIRWDRAEAPSRGTLNEAGTRICATADFGYAREFAQLHEADSGRPVWTSTTAKFLISLLTVSTHPSLQLLLPTPVCRAWRPTSGILSAWYAAPSHSMFITLATVP